MNCFLAPGPCRIEGKETGKILEVKKVVKMQSKVTTALIVSSLLIGILAIITPVNAADPNRILMIDIMAKGDDLDIAGGTTSIIGRIEFDKVSGIPLAQVEFHTKIYDESGEKIYSMKGKLKDGLVITNMYQFYCTVREVTWINLWLIMGEGKLKTTDTVIEIEHRGETKTLPNTGGQYVPAAIFMMVSPNGEHLEGVWEQGGWAVAGIMVGGIPIFGGVSYLTKYMEKWVP